MLKSLVEGLTQEGGFLRVRSIMALTVGGVYAYLSIEGVIPPEDVKEITLLVFAFYFITRAAQGALGKAK